MATIASSAVAPAPLITSLESSSHAFLQPPPSLHAEALATVKNILDPLAANVAEIQKLRRDENRKKRKRGDVEREEQILQLRQVYTAGLGVKQIWEQVKRVLDAACSEIERDLTSRQNLDQTNARVAGKSDAEDAVNGVATVNDETGQETEDSLEDGFEDEELSDEEELDGEDYDEEDDLDEDDVEDEDIEGDDSASEAETKDPGTFVPDPHNLNDGFFSIDDFNKQTQFLEQLDAMGEDDNPSDEDEIDWDADPLAMPLNKPKGTSSGSGKNQAGPTDEDSESDEEDGPTFGIADLNAPDSDEEMLDEETNGLEDGIPGLDNTNDIRYEDFFAPPPKKLSKTKRMRALPKTQPAPQTQQQDEDIEGDMQRAMNDVRRDLLESDEELSDEESGSEADGDRPSMKNMSTHEKQRAAIAAEIRRLEAANVAKRDWTLSGEARAADRPLNSLIEEDLEFERIGKPVPVVTSEVSEEIEQLIKRRILAREFDEVVRRHPDALGNANETRRGRVEVDDTKPQSGLAEVYEQEHLRSTDPGYVDKRSAATKKQHEEISRLWKEVSAQLDLLSNLHFKPKRVEAEIKTVEDKPTISMEDARPVGMGVNAEESMLAPQEVYRPGEEKTDRDLVVRKSGVSVNKDEMTREEKIRRRRREKERIKKAQAQGKAPVAGPDGAATTVSRKKKTEQEKADILTELRKGNVKVIDKKGELQDLGGKKNKRPDRQTIESGGGALKL
ncbi:Mpp10 protein, partial [Aureobasidium melanogenum]